jgi:hypothetical protein
MSYHDPTPCTVTFAHVVDVIQLPIRANELVRVSTRLEVLHGPNLTVKQVGGHLIVFTPGTVCGCRSCDEQQRTAISALTGDVLISTHPRMIVCPACGNKRCPHAWHHDHECTWSNEPGQVPHINQV